MIAIKLMIILMGILVILSGLIIIYIPFYVFKENGGIKEYFKEINIMKILISLLYIFGACLILLICYFLLRYGILNALMDLNN